MDLPDGKGTYVLVAFVPQMKRLEIGRLGDFDIVPGFYAYVGSAFGAGGLCARIGHHLESTAAPHWHIDYLLQVAEPVEVWFTTADQRLEHHWADLLEKAPQFRIPIPRFGQQLEEQFEDVHAEQYFIADVTIRLGSAKRPFLGRCQKPSP
jgi:Uri superfamily endonuclease